MDITSASRFVVDCVRLLGPLGLAAAGGVVIRNLTYPQGRARMLLALVGLAGAARESALRRLATALVLPILAITVLTVALAMEEEVREGPNRIVHELARTGSAAGGQAWVLEAGTAHLMNNSRLVGGQDFDAGTDPAVLPFWVSLTEVEGGDGSNVTGLVIAAGGAAPELLSPAVRIDTAECEARFQRCELRPGQAVTDPDVADIGTTIRVRGRTLHVVAHAKRPISLLNRAVVFTDTTAFTDPDGSLIPPYGIAVIGPDAEARAEGIAADLPGAEAVTQEALTSANRRFWAGNGTPLIVILIAMSAIFSGLASYAGRRAAQEHARVALGTLRAIGLTPAQATTVDLNRSLIGVGFAALVAIPLAGTLIGVANGAILGFHAHVGAGEALAAAGVLVMADVAATVFLLRGLRRQSVVEAISGA